MNTWHTYNLGNITTKIGSGATPRGGKNAYKSEGITLIRSMNVYDAEFAYKDLAFIDEKQAKKLENVTVEKDDVLINITGASVCRSMLVPENVLPARVNQHVSIIRADRKLLHPHYLSYYLIHPEIKKYLNAQASTGATRQALTKNDLETLEVTIPEYVYQEQIAEIISSYDKLIENNQKRIKILEEIAQRLYTEWFVKFKFPGHENVKMVDSGTEFGEIPEGWEIREISEIGKVITGSTPSKQKPQYYGSEYLLIKTPDFSQGLFITNSDEKLSNVGYKVQKTRLLPKHTVMVSTIGTLGKVAITTEESFTNQQINSLVLNNKNDYTYFYFFAKNLKKKLEGLGSNGATMGNVSKSKFESIKIIYPSSQLLTDFFKLTSSNFLEIECLINKNQKLIKMRDLLIENLVTGKRLLKN